MRYLLWGLGFVVLYFIVVFVREFVRATRDEDVVDASNLRMSIGRYKLYKEKFDEQVKACENGKTPPFFKAPDMNEWRRFGKYQEEKLRIECKREMERILGNDVGWEPGDRVTLKMEDGTSTVGHIKRIQTRKKICDVQFPQAVSIVPTQEPAGGWSDNAWPKEILSLTFARLNDIVAGRYVGTTRHYHFR